MTPENDSQTGSRSHLLQELEQLSRQRGRLLFDGQWLEPSAVRSHHRRLRWRSFWVVVETFAVIAALLYVAYILYLFVLAYVVS